MAADFKNAYGKLVAATWHDPALVTQLRADPARVLAQYGFPAIKAGTKFNISVVAPTGHGTFESQQAAWSLGDQTGEINLYIPQVPTKGATSGLQQEIDGTTCTPCCCCT
jgi:hypothetical protein